MIDILFVQISAVIITAGVVAFLARGLRQPLIIAYIITGIIVGPAVFGLTKEPEVFSTMAQIGIAFLLFLVGLNLNWRKIKDVGKISLFAGIGQMLFTSIIGYFIGIWLGFDPTTSILLGIAFAFSSTIVVVKMLSDKEDLDRFYGRISIGILIVQDLIAMVLLLVFGTLRDTGSIEGVVTLAIIKVAFVILALWLLARFVLPHVFRYAAHSQELLFLAGVSWCFAVASSLHLIGFGIEIGALLAGISLAGSDFNRELESKIRPLRDFFLIIFFIVLGTNLTFEALGESITQALIFSAFILIGNPLIVIIVLRLFGYHPRTGFLVGVTMAQISEFSFILLAGGIVSGFIDTSILAMATITGLITIAGSTYLIQYNEQIYERIEFLFRWMETDYKEKRLRQKKAPDVLVLGYRQLGEVIIPVLERLKEDYLVVDFDPAAIEEMELKGIPHLYGDAGSRDFLQHIRADKSKMVISTIPDVAINQDIIEFLKEHRSRSSIVLTVKTPEQAGRMYRLGATFVIIPTMLGGELFAQMLKTKKTRKTSWGAVGKRYKRALGA
ncbi:cation:proton antiporter [Patescibacteria group bacterium]|nr:cation:proton antiporter [Patescibacteria group bacterium]